MDTRDPEAIRREMLQIRAHDFYSGRGAEAKYLGTAILDADVGRLADGLIAPFRLWREGNAEQKYTEGFWEQRVKNLLALREDIALESVSYTWPHPYPHSGDTDYSWWFQAGGLYLYNLGALVEIRYPNGGIKSKLKFPTFTPKENTR